MKLPISVIVPLSPSRGDLFHGAVLPSIQANNPAEIHIMPGEGNANVKRNRGVAHAGQPFLAPYSTSKGALSTLTRHAGYALMRNRIRVNQLDIGWMNSDHERKIQEQEQGDLDFRGTCIGFVNLEVGDY